MESSFEPTSSKMQKVLEGAICLAQEEWFTEADENHWQPIAGTCNKEVIETKPLHILNTKITLTPFKFMG